MSKKIHSEMKLVPLAAALLVAFGSAYAQQSAEVIEMTSPDQSSATVGAGSTTGPNTARRFGQYTGLNQDSALLLDFETIKRDEASGTWTTLTGRDLGLDTREIGFTQQKQGDWKYSIDYNEIVRNDPYVIHTGTVGLGTTNPTINLIALPTLPTGWAGTNGLVGAGLSTGHDEQLKLHRTALGMGGDKWINSELQLEVNFRTEEKKGARMFGRAAVNSSDMKFAPGGGNGSWAVLLTPEPIDSSIHTIETKLNFNRDKLAMTGGYYGSFYVNNNSTLNPNVPGTLNRGALSAGGAGCATLTTACSIQQIASSPVALPPDNQAHQIYFSGTNAYSDTTRTNFKLSYTHATQNESFAGSGLTPSATAPASLGGTVDTTLAQVGLTMRPIKDLSLNTSLRYENRADKTPVYVYNYGVVGKSLDQTTNWPSGSQTRTTAKVDSVYRLPDGYSVNGGVEWERKETPLPLTNTAIFNNQVAFRDSLDESGMRLGIRKSMSETLNGAFGVEFKQRRGGSDWKTGSLTPSGPLVTVNPALANIVLADMYMDRDRTKARGSLDWSATEKLSIDVTAEHGQDDYKRDFPKVLANLIINDAGARVVTNDSLSLDVNYKISEDWNATGYMTHSESRWKVNKAGLGDDTFNTNDTLGFTVKGKVSGRVTLGMDVVATTDGTRFNNVVSTTATGNIAGWAGQLLPGNYLPSINYATTKLNLFSSYEVDKKTTVRVNLAYQEFKTDDWQWGYNGVPYLYSDNTTVSNPNQTVTFLGVAFVRKF